MLCPECNPCNCPAPDFIERNGTWLLGVIGVFVTCFGGVMTFMLKSRCSHIKFCGLECNRTPIPLDVTEVEIETVKPK